MDVAMCVIGGVDEGNRIPSRAHIDEAPSAILKSDFPPLHPRTHVLSNQQINNQSIQKFLIQSLLLTEYIHHHQGEGGEIRRIRLHNLSSLCSRIHESTQQQQDTTMTTSTTNSERKLDTVTPSPMYRAASTVTMTAIGFLAKMYLNVFNSASVHGLDSFIRMLDERADVQQRKRGLITGK